MGLVFEITRPAPIGFVQVNVRSPEFGDVHSKDRRQPSGETEGGELFIQDVGVDQKFFDAPLTNLTATERADLEFFFSKDVANKRQRPFELRVVDNKCFGLGIATGQGWSTGDNLASGSIVFPAFGTFGLVRLEQTRISFSSIPRDRFATSLRFRILTPPECS